MGAVINEIYKCEACGNVVMVLDGGAASEADDAVCWVKPMNFGTWPSPPKKSFPGALGLTRQFSTQALR